MLALPHKKTRKKNKNEKLVCSLNNFKNTKLKSNDQNIIQHKRCRTTASLYIHEKNHHILKN